MNKKTLILFSFALVLLTACSPVAIAPSSGIQPTPVESADSTPRNTQPLMVENVDVVVGIGSPLPVDIVVSGTWQSLCSQIAEVQSTIQESRIDINILASMAESCPPDELGGLPFRFAIPLNVVELKEGTYTITVNGVSTSLDLPVDLSKGRAAIFGWVWHDQCASGPDGQPAPATPPAGCVDDVSPVGPYHANGVREPSEPPIDGVTVRLFRGGCTESSLVQVAETKTIASDVSYSFTDLPAGIYCVSVDPQEDVNRSILEPGMWTYPTVTTKAIMQTVTLESTEEGKYNVDFGWDDQLK